MRAIIKWLLLGVAYFCALAFLRQAIDMESPGWDRERLGSFMLPQRLCRLVSADFPSVLAHTSGHWESKPVAVQQ